MGRFFMVYNGLAVPTALILLWFAVFAVSRCCGYLRRKVQRFFIATRGRLPTSLGRALRKEIKEGGALW